MKKWILKAIVQKIISFFPFKERINYFFQKYVTKGVNLTEEYFNLKLRHAKDHINFYNKYCDNINSATVVELGTGWYPIAPISFFLGGFSGVISIDIYSWLKKENVQLAVKMFLEYKKNQKLAGLVENTKEERWKILEDIADNAEHYELEEICGKLNFAPLVKDARNTGFETDSIDFICSNNTFEHIPPHILREILKEFVRILKPEGLMSHFIDMSDHFANIDSSISRYNFLQYSEKKWNLIDNSIQPQNRLRFRDYIEMYRNLNIPVTEEIPSPADAGAIKNLKIDDSFKKYTNEEIAVLEGYIISKYSSN